MLIGGGDPPSEPLQIKRQLSQERPEHIGMGTRKSNLRENKTKAVHPSLCSRPGEGLETRGGRKGQRCNVPTTNNSSPRGSESFS
jgi:hypothetical protein